MSDYERPSFNSEWWEDVREYIKQHPQEGFTEDEVKQFIKYAVNRRINREPTVIDEDKLNRIAEQLKED